MNTRKEAEVTVEAMIRVAEGGRQGIAFDPRQIDFLKYLLTDIVFVLIELTVKDAVLENRIKKLELSNSE